MRDSLTALPDEVLQLILRYLDPHGCLALERTARRFTSVANEPAVWRHYCTTRFCYWDRKHDLEHKLKQPPSSVDWKRTYVQRHRVDSETTKALNDILSTQCGRIQKVQSIMELGYDVKDTLMRHAHAGDDLDDHLARRYYSNTIMDCLNRHIAITEWAKVKNGETVSLERALGCFDLFVSQGHIGSLEEISRMLDDVANDLSAQHPDLESLSPRKRALHIVSFLRRNNITGIIAGKEYHSLEHNFIGYALKDPEHNSLPLISASIFCYIARRFGLNAHPCGFPFHVLVIIIPEPGFDMDGRALTDESGGSAGVPMYMDPFRSGEETSIADLQSQLNLLGWSPTEHSAILGKAQTSEVVSRCGRNVINSVRVVLGSESSKVDIERARYAGLWSFMLFNPYGRLMDIRRHLLWFLDVFASEFPWDISLVEKHILPVFEGPIEVRRLMESLHAIRAADETPRSVRRRRDVPKVVKYRVGDVFRHRRYNYTAMIIGWDPECDAGEHWMRHMNVDQLQAGRHQSFYHVHVEDKSVRYVAEENIEIIKPTLSQLPGSLLAIAGKHFKRWDEGERKFVSNIQDEYPDG